MIGLYTNINIHDNSDDSSFLSCKTESTYDLEEDKLFKMNMNGYWWWHYKLGMNTMEIIKEIQGRGVFRENRYKRAGNLPEKFGEGCTPFRRMLM